MDGNTSLSKVKQAIREAFESWDKPNDGTSPLDGLQIFQQTRLNEAASNARQATNQVLLDLLKTLEKERPENARLLSRHFLDGEKMRIIANSLNMGEATAYRRRNEAIERLALILEATEVQVRNKQRSGWEGRLERPSYTQLIGVEDHLDKLLDLLMAPGPPWLVSIEGLGGIGKTSLADALSRQMIHQRLFDDFGWVSARQYDFNPGRGIKLLDRPALTAEDLIEKLVRQLIADIPRPEHFAIQDGLAMLQARLKQRLHLIVIDNLETLVDIEALWPTLRDLCQPTKFLLTSRESFPHEHGIYHFPLPELSEANTLRLIRYEAQLHNSYLQAARDDDLKKIYEIVGGNPLALRLVVGQTHTYAMQVILDDLTAARGQSIENLYTFIYRRAWDALDELGRKVLLAMPLVAEGEGNLEHLAELSGVGPTDLRNVLNWLVSLNLIDCQNDMTEQHYSIHNLTRTFLHRQILRW